MIYILRILIAFGICLMFPMSLQAAEEDDIPVFRLGTASEGGVYHRFAEDLIAGLEQQQETSLRLVNVPTHGSVDNLLQIKEGTLDLAIVQNDIAYYFYEGKHGYDPYKGFSAGIPLFNEYVQVIVQRDSDIRILGDLRDRVISLGSQRSGSYRNAFDLMREIGLRSGIDYEARHLPTSEAMKQLQAGGIDTVVYTGASLPVAEQNQREALRVLPISREIIGALMERSSYYTASEIGSDITGETAVPTVSVQAYLVIGNHVDAAAAENIIKMIVGVWPTLVHDTTDYHLVSLESSVLKTPLPFHAGVKKYLQDAGILTTANLEYQLFAASLLLIGMVVWARRTSSGYDRLGNVHSMEGVWYYHIAVNISRAGTFIVIVVLFSLLVIGLVWAIRYFEMDYARHMNIENDFANVDFWDAMLWMFMFMGAGHPGDIFPQSTQGKILATVLPFIGISSMLGLFFLAVERQRTANTDRKRGTLIRAVKNHVLVCGWNEKVPGLIYALTNKDAPEKKKVVVVAEIEGDMPLERYNFNPHYVSYCRGDSADHETLERAHVRYAESAIIVAGLKKRKGRNIRSVLSAMALKGEHGNKHLTQGWVSGLQQKMGAWWNNRRRTPTVNRELFVAAEMLYEENKDLFQACRADAMVRPEMVANRLAAQSCISGHIVDFVMDMLTYDAHAEIYSIPVKRLVHGGLVRASVKWIKWQKLRRFILDRIVATGADTAFIGMKMADVRASLAADGINVVGVTKAACWKGGMVDHTFKDGDHYGLFLHEQDDSRRLEVDDILLYMADEHDDIYGTKVRQAKENSGENNVEHRALLFDAECKVLLVGSLTRCRRVAEMLKCIPEVVTRILTEEDVSEGKDDENSWIISGRLSAESSWERASLAEQDVVLVLTDSHERAKEIDPIFDYGEIDAKAIFAARFARQNFEKLKKRPAKNLKVVAEMVGHNNRSLFKDAGVDVVIPSSLLVERILTKLVYSRGLVCNYLMALLALEDNVHLYSFNLEQDHHEILLNKTFGQLMEEMPEGWQIMGILPGEGNEEQMKWRKNLINTEEDFDYHFIAHPELNQQKEYKTRVGDELVVIVDLRNRFRGE